MSIECIDDETEFLSMRDEWNALVATCDDPSPFLRHEWFEAAWRWRREASRLSLVTLRDAGRLVAVWPLCTERRSVGGLAVRVLTTLTVPDTQLVDVIAARADVARAVTVLARFAADASVRWDVIDLARLPIGSALLGHLASVSGMARWHPGGSGANHYLDLSDDWQTYYATRSKRLRRGNNLIANRLAKRGDVRVDWIRADGAGAGLEACVAMSARSWKSATGLTLDVPGPRAFIECLTEHAAANGWLSIWTLRVDGELLASEYQLIDAGRVYALRADYDEAQAKLSPGSYLNWKLVEGLCGRGLARYYMGPGENAYKLRWAQGSEALVSRVAYARSAAGVALLARDRWLRPAVRGVRARLRRAREARLSPSRS